jgi:hypothetical protein
MSRVYLACLISSASASHSVEEIQTELAEIGKELADAVSPRQSELLKSVVKLNGELTKAIQKEEDAARASSVTPPSRQPTPPRRGFVSMFAESLRSVSISPPRGKSMSVSPPP